LFLVFDFFTPQHVFAGWTTQGGRERLHQRRRFHPQVQVGAKLDPDPHSSEKLDPDPNSGTLEAQNRVV
jgi:hypothetical protein